MKKILSVFLMAAVLSVSSLASAAELKAIATIEKIDVKGDSATVTLKDNKGNNLEVIVKDQITLDKFGDKRIVVGDEVRIKYDDGSKVSKLFRKTGGC